MLYIFALMSVFLLPVVFTISNEQYGNVFIFKTPKECKRTEIYDLDYFNCVSCDSAQNLVPSSERFYCNCADDSRTEVLYDSSREAPICNNSKCDDCETSTKCNIKFVSNIRNGTVQKSVQIFYENINNCSCDPKLNYFYEDYCISNNLLKKFLSFQLFTQNDYFRDLKFVTFFCKTLKNVTACNHLANLCVASFYSLDKNSPCSLFLLAQTTDAAVYGGEDLKNIRPFLFYKKGKEATKMLETLVDYSYSLNERNETRRYLDLFGIVYSRHGTLQWMGSISQQHLNLCNRYLLPKRLKINFPQNEKIQCQMSLENIIDFASLHADNQFWNIFINYTNGGVSYLQSVPILVQNAMANTETSNSEDWQLVKRFQMIHAERNLYGHHFGAAYENSRKLGIFKAIKIVDRLEIAVKIKEGNKITVPLIKLQYRTININRNSSLTSTYSFSFNITFNKTYSVDFWFEILLPLLITLGFVFAALRTFSYKTRENKEFYDSQALIEFTFCLLGNSANAFFSVALSVCFYTFLMSTYQSTVKLLLPMPKQDLVEILLHMATIFKNDTFGENCIQSGEVFKLSFKGIYLAHWFWKITSIDLFFIDWERPRGCDNHMIAKGHLDTPSVCSGVSGRSLLNDGGVSAWRVLFVANEWNYISKMRKTSSLLQFVMFLTVFQLIKDLNIVELQDKTLRLAFITFLYVVVYIVQLIARNVLWSRISGSKLQQFVDLCSLANISVFILLQGCYGFYVHGRSPHGFSDAEMSWMVIQLQRESHNITGKRGLLAGSDQQVFTILAPSDFRVYYGKLLMPLIRAANISQVHFEKEFAYDKSHDITLEKTSASYNNVNRFFCAFIDHAIKDLDYVIKDRSCIETLLDCEFNGYLTENKGTFYIDSRHSFEKVLLYGNEKQMFIFEIFLLLSVSIVTESVFLAVAFTTVGLIAIQIMFSRAIKNNLANKTLIDKRFLI